MKTLLILFLSIAWARADWGGDGNFNAFQGGPARTNDMNSLSNNITITVWLRIRNTGTGLEQKNMFFGKGSLDFGQQSVYLLMIKGSKLQFHYNDLVGGLHTYTSTSTFVWTNVLRFVALTYTYTNGASMQMYMDGVPIAGSWTSGNGDSNTVSTALEFSLSGPTSQVTGGGILMGEQGPVAVWSTNLTYAEIQRLYTTPVHGMPYIIQPEKCIMYMNWDQHRASLGMDPTQRCADRSPANRHMPAISGASGPKGIQILSFPPNE